MEQSFRLRVLLRTGPIVTATKPHRLKACATRNSKSNPSPNRGHSSRALRTETTGTEPQATRRNNLPAGRSLLCCYNATMTFLEITYELQSRLQPDQLRALASFANTYGLRRFRLNDQLNRLSLEYDASRLKETQVEHVLRQARIPVLKRVEPVGTVSQT